MDDLADPVIARLTRERDLYRRLLDLGGREELEPFLEEALGLVIEMTGAESGYLELQDPTRHDRAVWSLARRMSDDEVEGVRGHISRGIMAEALATGETIVTNSALLDDRFSGRESVQSGHVEAVICAPIGASAGLGAVYLQGPTGAGGFSEQDRECVEIFATHLAPLADRLLARARAAQEDDPTRRIRETHELDEIVGRSRALAEALEQAMLAAPLDVNVLITGESGTGKTQLARAIHRNSARAGGPFVELNCAALPEPLLENELFGASAGAHSGATRDVVGKVAAAEGGTMLLDEIGELPLSSQAKLLQLLQSREYFPLGSATAKRADIRVIAATNADLEDLVERRLFREDLYFRLHVLSIRMPSLSDRREDLADLARSACARAIRDNRLPQLSLSATSLRAIEVAEWPGNIRQLESSIAAAAIRATGDTFSEITPRHLFPESQAAEGAEHTDQALSFQEATRRFQRDLLARSLDETDWNVSETARRLDLARSHVYKLIDAFGFKRSGR